MDKWSATPIVIFRELCNIQADVVKLSFVRHMPNGWWGVFSHKGKLMGKYKTKELANKRLSQIEYFKYHKASKTSEEATYSSLLRQVKKKHSLEFLKQFQAIFKNSFDQALINKENDPEKIALDDAMEFLSNIEEGVSKVASAIEMGNATYAGKYIAEIIKFLMRRISPGNRQHSLNGVKHKIRALDEYDISSKKMPPSSAMGQSINLVKQLLLSHTPEYIRSVINSIVNNL